MQTLSPSAQEGVEGVPGVEETAQSPGPLFDGPESALWAGFGAFLLIFLLVLMLIIRGRVIRPAQRKAISANFFEPAGEDAEITFEGEDEDDRREHKPAKRAHKEPAHEAPDDPDEAEITINRPEAHEDHEDHRRATAAEIADAPAKEKKPTRSPFAGLFSKKTARAEPEQIDEEAFNGDDDDEFETVPEAKQWLSGTPPLQDRNDAVEMRRRAAEEEERLREAEAAAEQARLRAEEDQRRERLLAAEQIERESEFERRKPEAAQDAPLGSLNALAGASHTDVERLHHSIDLSLQERFADLSRELHRRLDGVAARPDHHAEDDQRPVVSEAYFAEFADLLGEQIASLRDSVNANIEHLKRRVDLLSGSPEGAGDLSKQIANLSRILGERPAGSTAARVQLSDLLNDALPPDRYSLSRKLSNNKTADGRIEAAGLLAPIAIDARFPVEAFDDYLRQRIEPGQGVKAGNDFRRAALRHIVNVAENLIVPGETADCAILFVPSEHILSELHASFPDIVQESYRARIWMVSPTSLMATLHTISAVLGGAKADGRRPAADTAIIEELSALRRRIEALEHNGGESAQAAPQPTFWENGGGRTTEVNEPHRGDLMQPDDPVLESERSLSPEEEAFERLEQQEAQAEEAQDQKSEDPARPPFPLR